MGKHLVKYYGLVSARTGYGVEELISKIFRYWSQHGSIHSVRVHFNRLSVLAGGVYLLGGTNAGKSSLFNSLIDSDLCHIHALDCIQRATVSNLPGSDFGRDSTLKRFSCLLVSGTTMNVLRFPIQLRTGKNQFLRTERLKEREDNEMSSDQQSNPMENPTTVTGEIPGEVHTNTRLSLI